MSLLTEAAALIGRLLLSALFLHEAWSKVTAYGAAMASGNSCAGTPKACM